MGFVTVEEAAAEYAGGRFVIIVDDEDRENEGDLSFAADFVSAEAINFMAREGRGLICVSLTEERCDQLELHPMVEQNTSNFGTAFTVSVEARGKTTTGISAADRAATVRALVDPKTKPHDLLRPGHTFPLRARKGGVLKRAGQTEASVDLARIAGQTPAAVICEIMNADGTMARVPDLLQFSEKHGIPIVSVADIIRHRMRTERLVSRVAAPHLPTCYGDFKAIAYRADLTNEEHLALVKGEWTENEPVLVRVHSSCLTGDVFGSARCDCGAQLSKALEMISGEGKGVLLYLLQEGRGIGLFNKLRAYELQEQGLDTVAANERLGFAPDVRDYGIGCQILRDLGVRRMKLMTNNPSKYVAIDGYGLEIVERVPLEIPPTDRTRDYLATKKAKMGHLLKLV
ncbi:MAG TPA: bifunctional 3,4-dihydroxy-2-butanone-4-phosphate synthase/GTP cyclohydrolase II [Thermoanaerobaculia bacterium]|nr:bifunctional 3,4-dihydroxy-2-butanone-4-phosphate synthase/GTP cyclohydrolase II [Thermoanaerobaculia bacterium]